MNNENEATTLDAPPTPWEEDDPFADTLDPPGKDPTVEAEETLQSELQKIHIKENGMEDGTEESDEKVTRNLWAIVCMVPTWYPRKGAKNAILMQGLPSPDRVEMFCGTEEAAVDLARQSASNVLDMPPDMRREFLAYNVCGPYTQEEVDKFDKKQGPMAERPEHRNTRYIVSTRVYKKGTKNCQVSRLRPLESGPPKHDFAQRFPGARIPVKEIMAAAQKMGVEGGMKTLLMSHMEDTEIQQTFGDPEDMVD